MRALLSLLSRLRLGWWRRVLWWHLLLLRLALLLRRLLLRLLLLLLLLLRLRSVALDLGRHLALILGLISHLLPSLLLSYPPRLHCCPLDLLLLLESSNLRLRGLCHAIDGHMRDEATCCCHLCGNRILLLYWHARPLLRDSERASQQWICCHGGMCCGDSPGGL